MISQHITLKEAITSQTAIRFNIDNTPDDQTIERMKVVAEKCFEPMRAWYGKPLTVSSFYRCPALNKAVGGVPSSQHVKGEAIDIDTGSHEENKKLFEWAKANLVFDQLIEEFGDDIGPEWVHISFSMAGNRNESFRIK